MHQSSSKQMKAEGVSVLLPGMLQVRAAAMAAMARVLPLWALHLRCQIRHPHLLPQEQEGHSRRQPLGPACACEEYGAPAAGGAQEACGVAGDVAAALLKQACERIDRLRRVRRQLLSPLACWLSLFLADAHPQADKTLQRSWHGP